MARLPSPPVTVSAHGPGAARQDVRRSAQAYAEHLLDGGVTPWPEFLDGPGRSAGDLGPRTGWPHEPPGAPQAELLRRLNRRAGPDAPVPRALAEHVLRRAAPGRGRVDLRLTDPPVRVPVGELLRLAAGVLADLVADLPPEVAPNLPPGAAPGASESPPPARDAPSYRLEGPPLTVAALRRGLVAAGLPPRGGRRWRLRRRRPDVVLVVAVPLRRALFEVWSRRTQRGATKSWPGVLAEWHTARRVPQSAAYDRLAASWAARIGAARVHVVTAEDLEAQVAAVLGRPPLTAGGTAPTGLPPVLVEVVRRSSEVLTFRVPHAEKQQRLDRLVGILAEGRPPSAARGAAAVPPGHRRWLRETGGRTAGRLESGGYVVHGSLSSLGHTGGDARTPHARDRAVLEAIMRSVLRIEKAHAEVARPGDGGQGASR